MRQLVKSFFLSLLPAAQTFLRKYFDIFENTLFVAVFCRLKWSLTYKQNKKHLLQTSNTYGFTVRLFKINMDFFF